MDLPFVAVSATSGEIARIGYEYPAALFAEVNGDDALARARARDASADSADGILHEWQIMQTRLDREDEAEAMRELWRDDRAAWLERSKATWRARHLARAFARDRASGKYAPNGGGGNRGGSGAASATTRKSRPSSEPLVQLGERGRAGLGKVACSVQDLLRAGLVVAGEEKMFVVYQDNTWAAALGEDGVITFRGQRFTSPSAFAIFAKRITNPTKKADDGWKSVRYGEPDGPTLDQVKGEYARMDQLRAAGIDVKVEEAGRRKLADGSDRVGTDSPSPRSTPRKRKASEVVTASADDMTWTKNFPGCELGSPEPYAGTAADSNMDFSSLIGRFVCIFWEHQSAWMVGKVIKVRDLDTHVEADVLFANGKIDRGIDLEELAQEGGLVVLDDK